MNHKTGTLNAVIVPVTSLRQNCSIVWCEETLKACVIDPGGDLDRIQAAIDEAGVEVERILITHGHLDHCGAAKQLSERLGVPIWGPQEDDRFWIEMLEQQGKKHDLSPCEPFEPARWLNDGDEIVLGNQTLSVAHTPGHTPGHVVFYNAEAKIAFVGDVLFKGSIGRTDFPKGDTPTLIASITNKLWPLGDDMAFVPGHGYMSTFGYERETNPYVSDAVLQD